ncbi:uncharacterized protein NEMAJ01_2034 [Nematocida major]|uniref:uncharacterized protein n=1 Tax=Nematocida major TaxID=1912982 RepID=UPI0020083A47|nr:uncharacterized protein NEMAJ01_2034 [Nematocida major]KAH9387138.1 hypothetical protein NEMAJ01_2034 [Nematocida major]
MIRDKKRFYIYIADGPIGRAGLSEEDVRSTGAACNWPIGHQNDGVTTAQLSLQSVRLHKESRSAVWPCVCRARKAGSVVAFVFCLISCVSAASSARREWFGALNSFLRRGCFQPAKGPKYVFCKICRNKHKKQRTLLELPPFESFFSKFANKTKILDLASYILFPRKQPVFILYLCVISSSPLPPSAEVLSAFCYSCAGVWVRKPNSPAGGAC